MTIVDTFAYVNRIASVHGLRGYDVRGSSRDRVLVACRRHIAHGLRALGYSYPEIGRALGGRDHTTVMNLVKQKSYKRSDPPVPPVMQGYVDGRVRT